MRAVDHVIVETGSLYNNTQKLFNGEEVIINSTIESVENINRTVVVVSAPESSILQSGDLLIVHHNILRKKYSQSGREIFSDYEIEEGLYFVPITEVFMYKRGEDNWKAISPYCFVKPIAHLGSDGFSLHDHNNFEGNEHKIGEVVYINDQLTDQGLSVGDTIAFSEYSQYKFNIEGVELYKMSTKDILFSF